MSFFIEKYIRFHSLVFQQAHFLHLKVANFLNLECKRRRGKCFLQKEMHFLEPRGLFKLGCTTDIGCFEKLEQNAYCI